MRGSENVVSFKAQHYQGISLLYVFCLATGIPSSMRVINCDVCASIVKFECHSEHCVSQQNNKDLYGEKMISRSFQ